MKKSLHIKYSLKDLLQHSIYLLAGSLGVYLSIFIWVPLGFGVALLLGSALGYILEVNQIVGGLVFFAIAVLGLLSAFFTSALVSILMTHLIAKVYVSRNLKLSRKTLIILSFLSILIGYIVLVRIFSHPAFDSWIFN